jgi:hypothetical protein
MGLRHRNKTREKAEQVVILGKAIEGTRVEKIEALNACGYNISRKSDSKRVEKAMEKAIVEVGRYCDGVLEKKRESNRRKRARCKSPRR